MSADATKEPTTLGEWRDLAIVLFGEGKAVQFLDNKIEKQGRGERVLAHSSQMLHLLATMARGD